MHLKNKRAVKKNFLASCILIAVVLISRQSVAQYPIIPNAMEDSADAAMKNVQAISDEAFARAWPAIQADEKKGSHLYSGLLNQLICRRRKFLLFPVQKAVELILQVVAAVKFL
jgi:hypothetical protein